MRTSTIISGAYGWNEENKKSNSTSKKRLGTDLLIWLTSFFASIILALIPHLLKEYDGSTSILLNMMQDQGLPLVTISSCSASLFEMAFRPRTNSIPAIFQTFCLIISFIVYFAYFSHNESLVNNFICQYSIPISIGVLATSIIGELLFLLFRKDNI
ncbi:hypothetical protein SAMN02910436_02177 [Ruminococcaceae bacterium P7]|nr:hypothetical protein SAMN02910436_02177 [Ruminococcaceae bacterium P7]